MFELDARRLGLVGGIPGIKRHIINSDYSADLIPRNQFKCQDGFPGKISPSLLRRPGQGRD